jgi:hypothetical protein
MLTGTIISNRLSLHPHPVQPSNKEWLNDQQKKEAEKKRRQAPKCLVSKDI